MRELRQNIADDYPTGRDRLLVLVEINRCWRTSTVIDLGRHMLDANDFSLLPVLGDALMDAGCDSQELIDACSNEQVGLFARRICAMIASEDLAESVKWLDDFADYWNFDYEQMMAAPFEENEQGYIVAHGYDLHSRTDLDDDDEQQFYRHLTAVTGQKVPPRESNGLYTCSC